MGKKFLTFALAVFLGGCAIPQGGGVYGGSYKIFPLDILAPRTTLAVSVVNGSGVDLQLLGDVKPKRPVVVPHGGVHTVYFNPYDAGLYRASQRVCMTVSSIEMPRGTEERCFSFSTDGRDAETWHIRDLRYPEDPDERKFERDRRKEDREYERERRRLDRLEELKRRRADAERNRPAARPETAPPPVPSWKDPKYRTADFRL